jgi:hypothetical protein
MLKIHSYGKCFSNAKFRRSSPDRHVFISFQEMCRDFRLHWQLLRMCSLFIRKRPRKVERLRTTMPLGYFLFVLKL